MQSHDSPSRRKLIGSDRVLGKNNLLEYNLRYRREFGTALASGCSTARKGRILQQVLPLEH